MWKAEQQMISGDPASVPSMNGRDFFREAEVMAGNLTARAKMLTSGQKVS